jgi:putative membrane protein
MTIQDLPTLNASLNSAAGVLLLSGYIAIKNNKRDLHRNLMIAALIVSAAFLTSYLIYHFHVPSKKFPDLGWIKTLYFLILFPHIILAVVMVPMILKTFWHAYKQEWENHKKIARITFPIWMYVSVTGVIVYLMLYQWFPGT